jgi:hypothetical protein
MKISQVLSSTGTHTGGEPTRTITGGIPHILGRTIVEKMTHLPGLIGTRSDNGQVRICRSKQVSRIRMLKKFDSGQLWVALILGVVVLCLAVYRMWML